MTEKRNYHISLRVFHPSLDPDIISRELTMKPNRAWRAGEPRTTPKGISLPGVYDSTYWYTDLPARRGLTAAELVEAAMKRIVSRRAFLRRVVSSGGRWEFYVTGGGDKLAEEFGFQVLAPLADAKGDLSLGAASLECERGHGRARRGGGLAEFRGLGGGKLSL